MRRKQRFRRCTGLLLAMLLLLAVSAPAAPAEAPEREETALTMGTEDLSHELLQTGGFPAQPERGALFSVWDREGASAAILDGLKNREESIDVSAFAIPTGELSECYWDVVNGNPDLFFVSSSYSFSYGDAAGTVISIIPSYDDRYGEEEVSAFYQAAEDVLSQVDPDWDDALKLLFIHDYLVTHCEYDLSYSNYNAYNVLVEHCAVCQGYSLAFLYLAKQAGIDAWVVSSDEIDHAWNLVRIYGAFYHIDCTWDDPVSDYEGYCGHSNFLCSLEGIRETEHSSTDWVYSGGPALTTAPVTGSAYDGSFWKSLLTSVAFREDGLAYAFRDDAERVYTRRLDGTGETAYSLEQPLIWYTWNDSGAFYTENFSSFAVLEGEVYFTSCSQILHLWQDGSVETVYTLSDAEAAQGYIYGIVAGDGVLYYSLRTEPFGEDMARREFLPPNVSPVRRIELNMEKLSLQAGEQETLLAAVTAAESWDGSVIWESSDPAVANVDQDGNVTAVSGGSAVITAAAGDQSAQCAVTVTVPLQAITLDRKELTLYEGEQEQLRASLTPADTTQRTVVWSSSAPSVAIVSDSGIVTAKGAGTAVITAAAGERSETCSLTVEALPPSSVIGAVAASGAEISARGFCRENSALLVFAGYGPDGRMTESRVISLSGGGWRESVTFSRSFARVQVFLLGGEGTPLCVPGVPEN